MAEKTHAVHRKIDAGPLLESLASQPRVASAISVTKHTEDLRLLPEFSKVRRLWAREIPPKVMVSSLEAMTELEELHIFGTRLEDLEALRGLPIKHLNLVWANQITDLSPIGSLASLETAVVGQFKRATDFSPLADCQNLTALHIEAGIWSTQYADSLSFLRKMKQLRELCITDLKIADDDLTPICSLKNLEWLNIPNKFPVREYARLSVCLPDCECAQFNSYTTNRVGNLKDEGTLRWRTTSRGWNSAILSVSRASLSRCQTAKAMHSLRNAHP